jgi:hypothetical protein
MEKLMVYCQTRQLDNCHQNIRRRRRPNHHYHQQLQSYRRHLQLRLQQK